MMGMIDPVVCPIATLSFLSGCNGDLDHKPAQIPTARGQGTWSAVQVARPGPRPEQTRAGLRTSLPRRAAIPCKPWPLGRASPIPFLGWHERSRCRCLWSGQGSTLHCPQTVADCALIVVARIGPAPE
jgi:hypothetical protein